MTSPVIKQYIPPAIVCLLTSFTQKLTNQLTNANGHYQATTLLL
jgi:hypothetical protein